MHLVEDLEGLLHGFLHPPLAFNMETLHQQLKMLGGGEGEGGGERGGREEGGDRDRACTRERDIGTRQEGGRD